LKIKNVVTMQPAANPGMTIGALIYRHIREICASKIMGKSHSYSLRSMAEEKIGQVYVTEFSASHIVDHATMRRDRDKVLPQTIYQDVTYLSGALQMVKLWKVEGWKRIEDEYEEALLWLEKLGLIGKSIPRTRRPEDEELARIRAHYTAKAAGGVQKLPMLTMVDWQIESCRRISESCRIKWEHLDYEQKMYMVEDVKDPKNKVGNHMWFPALGRAWEILLAQPMVDERVFPYKAESITQNFVLMKHELNIINLRLHDLRAEGATRLLEQGYSTSEVRLVTGHKTTQMLDRIYARLRPVDLHKGPAALRALQRAV
jgi:integrase